MKIFEYIKNPYKIFVFLAARGVFDKMDDKTYLEYMFRARMERKLDLNNPQTFNEKLQWLKLYDRRTIYSTMVDKYEAKQYIADRIGNEYIIPTLGIWESFDDIDFQNLPNQFVLKCTHDSGGLVICKDKSKLNIEYAKQRIETSLKKNYYYWGREWPYKNVKPRIIAEAYMENTHSNGIYKEESNNLMDYKFFCFDGKVEFLYVSDSDNHLIQFYDKDYNELDIERYDYTKFDVLPTKPINFENMKKLAENLSKNIPHVRVDFYEINGCVYFGELTFYTASGLIPFKNYKWDLFIGNLLKLPM